MKKFIIFCLIGVMIASLVACTTPNINATPQNAKDILADVDANKVDTKDSLTPENSAKITDFGVKLLQSSLNSDKDNVLVSPISVIYALGMTANGADGDTLKEMENTFGLPIDELNSYMNAYLKTLKSDDKYKLNIANSIWVRKGVGFEPKSDFLQKNKDYYNAKIYEAAFDSNTVKEINSWVKDNTSGMIDSIIEKIPEEARMYLINALALEAEWEKKYSEGQVQKDDFTKEDGKTKEIDFMYGSENSYIEGENEKGFLKYYVDRKYSFVALLPNEGITIKNYVESLNGEKIHKLLNETKEVKVNTSIPKFENEFSISLNDGLKNMGIKKAFDANESDLSKIGKNLMISNVLHKTYISVHEQGTKAGAVTAVEVGVTSMPVEKPKEVYLNRPFVYMIVDTENNVPLFIGTYEGK
ncbi:MAG: serine protease [Tissierellia bacterium]|nr:serine protease [Tissierellia bacterium]